MKEEKLMVDGKRIDGRLPEQLRDIKMKLNVVTRANGSAEVKFGKTTAIASVHGPRALFPRYLQESGTGILRIRYNMAPFSVNDRKSPGPDRRSTEISKVIRLALGPTIFLEDFPKITIDGFAEIIEADGSTRVTAINALSLALAAAGIPMEDLVASCSVGKIDGTLVVDLNGKEDNNSEADMAFAMLPNKGVISLLQMDGALTKKEVLKLLQSAKESCMKIYEMQIKVLKDFYKGE